jgi:hypothetical protein
MPKDHEFIVTRDLYTEEENSNGEFEVKLIKKDLQTKWYCKDVATIISCEQHYNEKGNIRREYSKIIVEGEGERIIKMKYKDVKQLISNQKVTLGFKKR